MSFNVEATAAEAARAEGGDEHLLHESRWPPAVALLLYMALNIGIRVWLPGASPVRVAWLIPAIEAVLLVFLFVGNPGNLGKHTRRVHGIGHACRCARRGGVVGDGAAGLRPDQGARSDEFTV